MLNVRKRRDAAFDAPSDPAAFLHHQRLCRSNSHTHEHQRTCTNGTRGNTGCRMAVPYPHGNICVSCVELYIGCDDEHCGGGGGASSTAEENLEFRCSFCYADGASFKRARTPAGAVDARKILDDNIRSEDNARDLSYKARVPRPRDNTEMPDKRALVIELKRALLPAAHADDDALASLLQRTRETHAPLQLPDDANDAARMARGILGGVLAAGQPLAVLLQQPGMEDLGTRLGALTDDEAIRLVKKLTDPGMICRQGIIADGNPTVCGCVGCNAVSYPLGAGTGAIAAGFYQCKYMGKDCVEISAAASFLVDAFEHIKNYPSKAADSGDLERNAKHFVQRVLNHVNMELDATQAAGIVLGQSSSGHSNAIEYIYGHDVVKLAVAEDNSSSVEPELAFPDGDDGASDDDDLGDLVGALSPSFGDADKAAATKAALAAERDLLRDASTSTTGQSSIFTLADKTKVAVSQAEHYYWRDVQLRDFSAVEFALLFDVRRMDDKDQKWHEAAMRSWADWKAHGNCFAIPPPVDLGGPVSAGRPKTRFLLYPGHTLADEYIIVARHKWGVPALAGKPPPKEPTPADAHSAAGRRKQREFARFFGANFRPWGCVANFHLAPSLTFDSWAEWLDSVRRTANLEVRATFHPSSADFYGRFFRRI